MSDPVIPTYSSGTFSVMSTDVLNDSATSSTGSGSGTQINTFGVGTFNALYVNGSLSTGTPKAFPGLQT